MDIIDFFRIEQTRLHNWTRLALEDLTPEEWHHTIGGNTNSIAFLVWHYARTEDNILRFILQGRPTIWAEGNWHERLGLPPRAQGTGMASGEARAFHIADTALFMQYVEQVWREYEDYLASIDDGGKALSQRVVTVKPLGEMPAIQAIGQICITHLNIHYGEIAVLRGTLGKKGLLI
ncbi:MAG TPA: DinB family protein [Ktedonobacteraceae bacterium]|nr:DinB family protein [Ktedonobacteraceae bacterium]